MTGPNDEIDLFWSDYVATPEAEVEPPARQAPADLCPRCKHDWHGLECAYPITESVGWLGREVRTCVCPSPFGGS